MFIVVSTLATAAQGDHSRGSYRAPFLAEAGWSGDSSVILTALRWPIRPKLFLQVLHVAFHDQSSQHDESARSQDIQNDLSD